MVEQGNDFHHSDDDLTIDRRDNEPRASSVVDLYDSFGGNPSPIGRLKALVLSLNWEITDEVLRDFNEELTSLRKIWGEDPIKAVYLQALEKIGKYLSRAKSNAHPDAVKLLPILSADLEKIVQGEMSEDGKKELLNEDVRRFNHLKAQIQERYSSRLAASPKLVPDVPGTPPDTADGIMAINRLRALIPGIDREITEKDMMSLRSEVLRLENIFAHSRAKQLFLQGIGTLAAYIHQKKSDAHADAFPLLHDFFAGLEKAVTERLDFAAEKAELLPLVARFNAFKETATTSPAQDIGKNEQAVAEKEDREKEETLPPDVPQTAASADIEPFFTVEAASALTGLLGAGLEAKPVASLDAGENKPPPPADAGAPEAKLDEQEEEVEFLAEAAEAPGPAQPASPEELSLRDCVNALSSGINDDILDQSYRGLQRLHTEFGDQPLAAIYLQCIATIMQHIDQRRADASDEALPLLRRILDHFEDGQRDGASEKIGQFLVDDTWAVLSWQQHLIEEGGPAARPWLNRVPLSYLVPFEWQVRKISFSGW